MKDALHQWIKTKRIAARENATCSPIPDYTIATGIDLDQRLDEVIARAVMPGLDRKDLIVEVTTQRLVIRGAERTWSKKQARGLSQFEETGASFAKAVTLPCEVDSEL